jgi:chromosome segregation ATPase
MVQGSHTDWQQQEARKFSPLADEPTIDVTATSDYSSTSSNSSASEEEITIKLYQQEIAKLEATVQDLRESLQESQRKEVSAQEEISDLKSALSGHKELVERLKTELGEAKEAAMHLAKANAKLTETIDALNQEKEKAQSLHQEKEKAQSLHQEKAKPQPLVRYKKSYPPSVKPPLAREPKQEPQAPNDTPSPMWLLD